MAPSATASNGVETIQSKANGLTHTNGVNHNEENLAESHSTSLSRTVTSDTRTSTVMTTKTEERRHFAKDQQITILRDIIINTRKRFICEFHDVDEHYIDAITIEEFLTHIEQERLRHMPHKGSKWDRVLKWAEFFALQVAAYENAVSPFVPDSNHASKLIWTASQALLELGHGNAAALEPTFGAFYKLGHSISFFLRHNNLIHVTAGLRNEVGGAFRDLLVLVSDVAVTYRNKIRDDSSGPATLDFTASFGRQMEAFSGRANHIVDAMWEYRLGNDASMNVGRIRKWLRPHDKVTQDFLRNRKESLKLRADHTCEWFQRHLLDFSRGKKDVLLVTGPEGCGKSVLSGWIVERLQQRLAKKNFVTLSYSIVPDFPGQSTSLELAKNLALQLLGASVGDKSLFDKLSTAYAMSTKGKTPSDIENALWNALDSGLTNYARTENVMIIVDGLDSIKDNARVLNQFQRMGEKHGNLQTIILGRKFSSTNTATQTIKIEPDHVHNDLKHVVRHSLRDLTNLKDQNEQNREKTVEQIVHSSNGNFLWAILTVLLLKSEQTHAAFTKALGGIPKTIHELIRKVVGTLDLQKPDTKLLLQWLLVSNRPLTLAEVKCLYRVDMKNKTFVERKTDIREDINRAGGLLVHVHDGIVSFRFSSIRAYLSKEILEKTAPPGEDPRDDMTMRILLYCKLSLTKSYQPVSEIPGVLDTEDIFRKHELLEYSVRYWISHFEDSSLSRKTKDFEFSSELKAVFPTSTKLAVLEWKYWEYQDSASQAATFHSLARRVRQAIFTEKHESVLQSIIICANFHQRLHNSTEAIACFYHASRIGQEILHKFNAVIINCTKSFLTLTEKITSVTRTEIITQKEVMLKYIIVASKHQHTKTSEIVIQYYKSLAQLYVDIHEEHHAEQIYKELREIIVLRHGKGSEEEKEISKHVVISLKKDKTDTTEEYEVSILETMTTMEIWDVRRIAMTFKLALSFEASGKLFHAEEQYIKLWAHITDHCHRTHNHCGVDIHISVVEIAIEYVKFLRRHHRHQEAASVLICIWNEYEEYEFESEKIFLLLKVVGELMRAVSLLAVAVSVFKKCLSWFKSHSKHEHEASCEVLITETVEEITTTTVTATKTTSTTTSTTTQTVMKEIFESTLSRKVVTKETITVCKNLISLHMKLKQWKEAIEVTERSLTLIWKVIISGSGTLALPRGFDSEAIDIAISLAVCHYHLHHFHEAEQIYVRIYRACRISCRVDDERLFKSYTTLAKFYEEHRHWHKVIDIYRELLSEYRAHLGAKHTLTIKMLYTLGSLCFEHGHGNYLGYYEEVVTVLNGKDLVCHKDARDAMAFLCRSYYEEGHWLKLKEVCKILWETWTHHHKEHIFDTAFIELLYMRYIYVLEYHEHCEYEVIRTLTVQYRNTCLTVFGVLSIVTIKAMIELAHICMRSEKYIHEAVSIYEEVIKKTTTTTTTTSTTTTTTTISTTQMTSIKERLSKAYIKVCSHGSTSITTIERAIKVLIERFAYMKLEFGCAHSETLIVFRELIFLHRKLKTQESHATIARMLIEISVEIIEEKHSITLHEAAITLGGIFLSVGLADHGLEIISEIRKQMTTGKSTSTKKFGVAIAVVGKVSKTSYIFIVTLERVLRQSSSISYAEIMTEMLIEATLYEHYHMCLKSQTDVTVILTHAARLRSFLVVSNRLDQVQILEHHTFELFFKRWGAALTKTVTKEVTKAFFVGLLVELGVDSREIKFSTVACIASVESVKGLLQEGKYKAALDIALCSSEFLSQHRAYHYLENLPHCFRLSALMAGQERSDKDEAIEPQLHEQMRNHSKHIIREVFKAMKESNIDILRLTPKDLDRVISLLGAQHNYADLEWLLRDLWLSREVRKNKKWNESMVISIGRLLTIATSLAHPENHSNTIKICEDICYNLRRVWGMLHPQTLEMEELLSQVYTEAHHYSKAMGVHEDILRLVIEGDDGDDNTVDVVDADVARLHLKLLHASYVRLGGWDKSASNYHTLVRELLHMREYSSHADFKDALPAEKWSIKDNVGHMGKLVAPTEWHFVGPETSSGTTKTLTGISSGASSFSLSSRGTTVGSQRPRLGLGMKRVSSNWGLGFLHDLLHGHHEGDGEMHGADWDGGDDRRKRSGHGTLI